MHLFLRRQRREVAVPVAAPTAGPAVVAVRAVPRRDVYAAAGLYWLKVRDDGRVACRTKPGYKQIPAYFRGRLDETAQGVMLRGTIRESRSEGFRQDADRLVAGLTELFAFRPGRPGADPEAPDGPAVRSAGRW